MIAFQLSDNGNEITASIAEVNNGAAVGVPFVEGNSDINFLSNINLFGTNFNNNSRTLAENDIEEGLQAQCIEELK